MENSRTLHKLFEIQAKQNPRTIAIISGEQSLTYEQLNQKANQLAHYLRELGVKPDTPVALCMERSIDLLIVILGILKAGGAYVPLDLAHPEERLLLILNEGTTRFLITTSDLKGKFIRYQGAVLLFDTEEGIRAQQIDNPHPVATSRHLAYIIYTSGSTGTPKGVLVEHRSVVDYSLWFANYCDCQPQQRIDFSSNPAFDFALTTSIVPLTLGLTLVICTDRVKKDTRLYLKYLQSNKINFIKLTPSYFRVLLYEIKNRQVALSYLEKIMLAGENLLTIDCASWLAIYPEHILFNEYGPTEASVAVCLYKIDSKNIFSLGVNVPIGNLAPHIQSYILDENRIPVANGEIGELYLGGRCLARGYLNNPVLTQQNFINNPFSKDVDARLYKTGDLCRQLPKGEIEYIGRIDYQIKIRGFRVEPAEVENCLTEHPALKATVVTSSEASQGEKRLVAYYILKDPSMTVSDRELRQYLKLYLPNYMIPTSFVRMDAFPLNANEKLDRSALPAPQFISSQSYLAPRTSLEKKLVEIWSEELGIKPIGVKEDFFELGGHSLSAARIISKINHQFDKEVSLHDFYQTPTIAYLVTLIKKAKKIDKRRVVLNKKFDDETSKLPLSDFQFLLWLADTFEPKAKKLNIFTRKRIAGRPNIALLTSAFEAIFQKHEVLSYRLFKFRPMQGLQKNLTFKIIEKNLESLSEEESELALENSVHQLMEYYPWPKNVYPVMIRLFYLKDGVTELQMCIPHLISDDVSLEILLADLSRFYVSNSEIQKKINRDIAYRDYLFEEQSSIQKHLNHDMTFWKNYLEDATLFAFSSEHVVKNMQAQRLSYSTYVEIPEETLNNFQVYCKHHQTSILDGLCAVLMLALLNCCQGAQKTQTSICINRVKSTRDNPDYDNTIGCFLRLEPIKLTVTKKPTLASLLQQVHESVMATNPYQRCSNLVKLASIGTFRRERKMIKTYLIKFFIWLYTTVFRSMKLNRKTLNLCGRLSSAKGNNFLININVQNSFLANLKKSNNSTVLGFKTKNIRDYHHDLLTINNLLDIFFLRMAGSNAPFLIISANLDPIFRKRIATEMIKIIDDEILTK